MDKLFYIKQAAANLNIGNLPDDQGLNILLKMYGTQYHNKDELGDHLDSLLESNLIEESCGMYIISIEGDTLVEAAMNLFVEAERPDLLVKRKGSNKREITNDMESFRDHALKYLEGKLEVKEVVTYRSNFFINFPKRIKGLGGLEIKNRPEIRVCIRKPSKETIEHFASIGMTYRSATNQTYFDMPRCNENIEKLIDAIVEFFNI
ncbi:hypothetical protein ACX818_001459 [Acinetobacter baumannii]